MSAIIEHNKYVVVQKMGGEHLRVLRFTPKLKVLIEKLRFEADSAVGHRFGLFEVVRSKASPFDHTQNDMDQVDEIEEKMQTETPATCDNGGSLEEAASISLKEQSSQSYGASIEDDVTPTEGNPAQAGQKLTQNEVLEMKSKGTNELVAKLVEGNNAFFSRTVFAQSKYIRRKVKKHSDRVFIMKPNIRLLAQAYYLKDADRMANLRIDQLGLLLQMAGIHHNRRVLIFEQTLGLVTSAVLERLGGEGACIHLHRGEIAQSIPCIHAMNYEDVVLSSFLTLRIARLLGREVDCSVGTIPPTGIERKDEGDPNDPGSSINRRTNRLTREQTAFDILHEGLVDSVIIASRTVDPIDILEKVWGSVRIGAAIAIYSPNMQIAVGAMDWLMARNVVNVQLSDQMYRVHQVLPDRTHPLMSQNIVGGYVLSGIKVQAMDNSSKISS